MMVHLLLQLTSWSVGLVFAAATAFVCWHRLAYRNGKPRTIAFFHPFCASGGGGERVLWAIVQALGEIDQKGLSIQVVIYTVDPPSETYKRGASRFLYLRQLPSLRPNRRHAACYRRPTKGFREILIGNVVFS